MTSAVAEKPDRPPDRTEAATREDLELQQARELLAPPDHWEDGFGLKSIIGAIFVGIIMTPASMYMGLVVGTDIGSAAQWVTIILFIEVARRAFTTLKRPEIYILYYMAGASLVTGSGLLWNQFIVQSESFRQLGIADKIPAWVAPSSPDVLGLRSFFHPAWMAPIGLVILGLFLQRLDHFGLGYVMYRLTSDVEKLPFPMAPVAAQGITALADASGGQETWRWRVFSFGAMLGMFFGGIYLALPTITGALLPEPISIFPLPFKDLTPNTETLLPGVPMMLSLDLGLVIAGMVLPFWAMVGSFIGLILVMAGNPILYHTGILKTWRTGIGAPATINSNYLDFYLSFGLGLTAAIAVIGFWHIGAKLMSRKRERAEQGITSEFDFGKLFRPPPGRGDFSIWIGVGIYVVSTLLTIGAAWWLLTRANVQGVGGPITARLMGVLLFYGFVFTPIMSYVGARVEGIVGQSVPIPFVREATLMLTGYQGAAIWFVPFAPHNYGNQALYFRVTELTGTKITSLIKAEIVIFPIILIATLLFSQFVWRIAPIPSSAFPWAEKWWEVNAFRLGVIYSSTLPGGEYGAFYQSFNVIYMLAGLLLALVLYSGLAFYGLPVFLAYGIMRGLDHPSPAAILPQFIGALLGRQYFARKFGEQWKQYIIVFFAGYSCGMGLVMMFSLGIVFMSKSVFQSVY